MKQLLNQSKLARWTALGVVSFTMMAAYFMTDVMSPLKGMLEKIEGWSSADYGLFTSAYGWFNVFLLMLFFGGLLLDKRGIRFTGTLAAAIMVVGAGVKYLALANILPTQGTVLGVNSQVMFAAIGYAIFSVGAEVAGITVTKAIVKWFRGHELALAMGLQVAVARIGTAAALIFSNPLAHFFGGVSHSVLFGLTLLVIGLLAFLLYTLLDKKYDRQAGRVEASAEDEFKLSDVKLVVTNHGFWLISLLCVLFYSCVFPFLKYAADLMVNKFSVNEEWAGLIPGLLPFGTILLTPLFGGIYDKRGKGATIMIIGALMLVGIHILFSIPGINSWIYAVSLMVMLGIAFSLVPSAMWPSVPKIIPEKQLGTAYALIFWVQNIGLMGVPYLIGVVLDRFCKTVSAAQEVAYDYTIPMLIFAAFAVLSLLVAVMLKREDKKRGYGLEKPNASKH
ncbi:MAG: MFS transporter [Prevotellaceae bacterium]|jgi:predicted MFS family arabinose efflux permease|nr:MFS transporter [Prevotellaceae bacterium]